MRGRGNRGSRWEWEPEHNRGSRTDDAGQTNLPAKLGDDAPGDCESQSGPALRSLRGEEGLEDALRVECRNTSTRIHNLCVHAIGLHPSPHGKSGWPTPPPHQWHGLS